MWGIQHRSPKTKNRWWWIDGKWPGDPAELNKTGGKYEARWLYKTQAEALKWAEKYRADADEDSEWRIVPVQQVRTT